MKTRPLLALAALAALVPSATAQSRFSEATIGATNRPNEGFGTLDQSLDANGAFVSASVDRTFTGLGGDDVEREMRLVATARASADYGRMRAALDVTISNTYLNPNNLPFYTEEGGVEEAGSPDVFINLAFAGFRDDLRFDGVTGGGYTVKYVFFVEGDVNNSVASASVVATVGSNPFELLSADTSVPGGRVAQYLTTRSYAVESLSSQILDVYFTTQFNPTIVGIPDGSTLQASADFSSTATLAAVLLYNANGDLATNYTVTGLSGTSYPVTPVPEPASMVALGFGALALLRRRKAGA